jgi:hypothetical protein
MNLHDKRREGAKITPSTPVGAERMVRHNCRGETINRHVHFEQTEEERVKMALSLKFAGLLQICSSLPLSLRKQDRDGALISYKADWRIPLGVTISGVNPEPKVGGQIEWLDVLRADFNGAIDRTNMVLIIQDMHKLAEEAFRMIDEILRGIGYRLADIKLNFGMVNGIGLVITNLFNLDTMKVARDGQQVGMYLADEGALLDVLSDCNLTKAA